MGDTALHSTSELRPHALGRFQRHALGAALAGIALMVGLVSIPCVEAFAVQANERDARVALHLLQDALREAESTTLVEAWRQHNASHHRLVDARELAQDRLLYHGYVLAWVDREQAGGRLLAWPRLSGGTGRLSYELSLDGSLRILR